MSSDRSHPRPYPPPFLPMGNPYGHQIMWPTHRYTQSERVAPTDQGRLSLGDLSNPRAENWRAELIANLERLEKQIQPHAEREMQLAKYLGIPTEKLDSLKVSRKVDDIALHSENNSPWRTESNNLATLHHLRLEHSRALNSFNVKMEARHPPPGVPHSVDGSRFWAIIIGIDDYESNPLNGCVEDAKAMEKYLLDDLHVPKKHIQLLLGPASSHGAIYPSRDNIIGALFSIITNGQIRPGDNIIIYFAGHGSYYIPSESDLIGPRAIEAICPIDRDKRDDNKVPIPDISNRELRLLPILLRGREKLLRSSESLCT